MQRFLGLFLQISVHVSCGSSAHHQEHKTVHTASGIVKPILLPAAIVDEMECSFSWFFLEHSCSTCFRRFFHPSSGAQSCTWSFRYCQTNTAACCYRGWDGNIVALHVSGGSSAHHQEHKTVHAASGIVKPVLLPAAIMVEMERSSISSTIAAE